MLIGRRLGQILLTLGLACSACGDDGGGDGETATHAQALEVLGRGTGCAVPSCHGTTAEAALNLNDAINLRALMVDKPACEAPALKLVEPGDPSRSWLWIKLTAEIQDNGDLQRQPSWGEPGNCPDAPGFGKRMPRVGTFEKLSDEDLAVIESWIKGGAPGPT